MAVARIACAFALLVSSHAARAEGERSPMVGGSIVATRDVDAGGFAGAGLEVAQWWGHIGLGLEGSRQWAIDSMGPRVTTLAGTARVLLFTGMVPSLLEPSDCELGIELQGIVQRAWWANVAPAPADVEYGAGIALRLRGGSDDAFTPLLIAESRVFVRVMRERAQPMQSGVIAKGDATIGARDEGTIVLIGLGALFGGGDPKYVQRFKSRWPSEL
jgi:hypothetical protein